jgi:hypothetical protein
MIAEPHDDIEFSRDLDAHPTGFVLNCNRSPIASYLCIHRTTCGTLRSECRSNDAGGYYRKICSEDRIEIEHWASQQTGATPRACGICIP